mmetsp:Transcript_9409/g.14828  ORF Transcript_9409/g.14828 Transcript_9409/m.14828 type:complete len:258 (-) Transcript_9409:113-886(-)
MKAVTGMTDPEEQLGLGIDPLTRARYQGVSFLGFSGALSLLAAGVLTPSLAAPLAIYGYATLAVNIASTVAADPIDKWLQKQLLEQNDMGEDRWARRQAGRLIAAYCTGVPLEYVMDNQIGLTVVKPYSRQSGNCDIEELRASVDADGYMAKGLSKRDVDRQSIVQMTGLVAEYKKYGKATMGNTFFSELDSQLDLSDTLLDRRNKQIQARYGVVAGYQLLERHEEAFELVSEGLKCGKTVQELISILEMPKAAAAE